MAQLCMHEHYVYKMTFNNIKMTHSLHLLVRFTYGDPLVAMLCNTFDYYVELEDTMDET